MRLGLGHLRLAPRDFWALTLIEYDAATRGYLEAKGIDPDGGRMSQRRLDELMAQFPDDPQPASP